MSKMCAICGDNPDKWIRHKEYDRLTGMIVCGRCFYMWLQPVIKRAREDVGRKAVEDAGKPSLPGRRSQNE